jgi:hypothetical protein
MTEHRADGYRVVHVPHGTLVFGPLPVLDLPALQRLARSRGYTILDLGIAAALDATMAFTSRRKSKLWRAEVDAAARKAAGDDTELAWTLGTDTGTSAMTILLVLGESVAARERVACRLGDHPGTPHDADDLGRCIRLLDLFPAWRGRLVEVAAAHPAWAPLVGAWDELAALYRQEAPKHKGMAPKTSERIHALRGER